MTFSAERAPSFTAAVKRALKKALGRWRALSSRDLRFRGAFESYEEAMKNVHKDKLAGYDHEGVSSVHEDRMERINATDYPVLFWLERLKPTTHRLIDAGGHTGVKYRAFAPFLDIDRIDWIVFDVPAATTAGRARLKQSEPTTLSFIDRLEDAPAADILLGSGLMQYFDGSLNDLVQRMRSPPRYIVLNKLATRCGESVVTLENFGFAEIPYQIRDEREIPASLEALGYDIIDAWINPSLANVIPTHPELGFSVSRGYVARRRTEDYHEPAETSVANTG